MKGWLALALLAAVGCTGPQWMPCPDRLHLGGNVTNGRYDGSDIAVLLGGEADGFDSNYEAYNVGGSLELALGHKARRECWGDEDD